MFDKHSAFQPGLLDYFSFAALLGDYLLYNPHSRNAYIYGSISLVKQQAKLKVKLPKKWTFALNIQETIFLITND